MAGAARAPERTHRSGRSSPARDRAEAAPGRRPERPEDVAYPPSYSTPRHRLHPLQLPIDIVRQPVLPDVVLQRRAEDLDAVQVRLAHAAVLRAVVEVTHCGEIDTH